MARRDTVLITGCASPVGRATALAFREEDWRVYATAAEEEALADLAERGCETDALDVTDYRDRRRVLKRVLAEADRLDCLVLVPGAGRFGPIEEVPIEDAREQFEADVLGPLGLIQRALPHMRERGDGTVVTVANAFGRIALPGTGVPGGAAAAVAAIHDALRAELEPHGVDAVLVEPAVIDPAEPPVEAYGKATAAREGAVAGEDGAAGKDLADDGDDGEPAGPYGWVHETIADFEALGAGGVGSVPPERVAAVVVNAASATMPAPRYPVGWPAQVLGWARYLPSDWRDLAYGVLRRLA